MMAVHSNLFAPPTSRRRTKVQARTLPSTLPPACHPCTPRRPLVPPPGPVSTSSHPGLRPSTTKPPHAREARAHATPVRRNVHSYCGGVKEASRAAGGTAALTAPAASRNAKSRRTAAESTLRRWRHVVAVSRPTLWRAWATI